MSADSVMTNRKRQLGRHSIGTWVVLLASSAAGCSEDVSRFVIVDHRQGQAAEIYREQFPDGYYRIDEDGNADVVLRRSSEMTGPGTRPIEQIIHLRTFWRSRPGITVADQTQLNATVCYAIETGRSGALFEGSGSLLFYVDEEAGRLRGELDRAVLTPTQKLYREREIFERAQISGTFYAQEDPRRVVRLINEINRKFRVPELDRRRRR